MTVTAQDVRLAIASLLFGVVVGVSFQTARGQLEDEALPPAAPAPPAAAEEMEPPAEDASDAERETYWRSRAREARERVEAARERQATADAEYRDMRQRQYAAGEAKAKIVGEREAAAAELAAAIRYEQEELPEEARRAGALPGWLRLD